MMHPKVLVKNANQVSGSRLTQLRCTIVCGGEILLEICLLGGLWQVPSHDLGA